ncbi:MAG: PINc/VapC family ATPase [Nanoarchaeota archaeon]
MKKVISDAAKDMTKVVVKLVPDTSIIIEGVVSKKIEDGSLKPKEIIIHEAVIAELEAQANRNREIGLQGLDEIKRMREICNKTGIVLSFKGSRPGDFEIRHAKTGEIDSLIRDLAGDEKGTLMTGDKVQCLVAESKGIEVIFVEFEEAEHTIVLEKYFDTETMSVHLREGANPKAKKGKPGKWTYEKIEEEILSREFMQELSKEIIKETKAHEDGFIEYDRRASTIIQLANYRIVITRPPFSDGYEITAVRPVKSLTLQEYHLSEKLKERIAKQAEGILIAGAPGHGKTTFATALALSYLEKNKVVKTVEAPRDLTLPPEITQLSLSHGSPQEIHDILLLSRPDYTVFDEMRNTDDFKLFADLRLSGVGMVGVIHATNPIDAIQRFIGRIELGVIPHVIDTVIFIRNGEVGRVFSLSIEVKVPTGMIEADLARPVVVVHDFETGRLEFEIYSYGEQTIVIPISKRAQSPAEEIAAKSMESDLRRFSQDVRVDIVSGNKAVVYVPEAIRPLVIGKEGRTIEGLEKKYGLSIDVRDIETLPGIESPQSTLKYEVSINKKNITFKLGEECAEKDIFINVDGDYLLTARASKKAEIRVTKDNKIGKILIEAINNEGRVELKVAKQE